MRKDREGLAQRVIQRWENNPEMDLDGLYDAFSVSFKSKVSVSQFLRRNGINPGERLKGNWTEICRTSKTPERFRVQLH